jgi:hypothetical protein
MNKNQTDQEQIEPTEQEEPARTARQGSGLVKIDRFPYKTVDREKQKPAVINTEWRPPALKAPVPIKDTALIAQKRAELERLALEVANADRLRRDLVRELEGIEHQINARTGQLDGVATNIARVEDKQLPAQFMLLFKRSLYGELGPQDLATFARVGLTLSNKKLLLSVFRAEAEDIDDALVILEKQAAELREKLGPDAETEAAVRP